MERINKFLDNRPKKHQKVIQYRGERYEITKEDLKKVRAFRSSKCLDSSFKLSRPLDLSFSSVQAEAFPSKSNKSLSDSYNAKILKNIKDGKYAKSEAKIINKNEIVDVWENDDVETLAQYQQEWVYSVKEQYDRPVEELKYTREDLEEDLKRVHFKYMRPRDLKEKSIRELLPNLPDLKDLKPYPEFKVKEWLVGENNSINGHIVSTFSENKIDVWNIEYDVLIESATVSDRVKKVLSNEEQNIVVQTHNKVYSLRQGKAVPVAETKKKIKDIFYNTEYLAILIANTVHLYNSSDFSLLKIIEFKNDSTKHVKIFEKSVIVSTTNGFFVYKDNEILEINYLNYVIDFSFKNDKTFVVNNLGRLLVLDKSYTVLKTVVQHEVARAIRSHKTLNLIAIIFSNDIGIYKFINGESIPAHTIPGSYTNVEWDNTMPWLYIGSGSKVVLFS